MLENCKRLKCSPSLNKVYCIVLYCIVSYKVALTLESENEILKCDHSIQMTATEQYFLVMTFIFRCFEPFKRLIQMNAASRRYLIPSRSHVSIRYLKRL